MTWRLVQIPLAGLVCGAVAHVNGWPAGEVVVHALGVMLGGGLVRINDWLEERL